MYLQILSILKVTLAYFDINIINSIKMLLTNSQNHLFTLLAIQVKILLCLKMYTTRNSCFWVGLLLVVGVFSEETQAIVTKPVSVESAE